MQVNFTSEAKVFTSKPMETSHPSLGIAERIADLFGTTKEKPPRPPAPGNTEQYVTHLGLSKTLFLASSSH